jgi:hypothetical protein
LRQQFPESPDRKYAAIAADVWSSSTPPYVWRTVTETFSEFVAKLRLDRADAEPAAG